MMEFLTRKKELIYAILILLILGSGILMRFGHLDSIPPGIQYDEAYNGMNALDALKTGNYKLFYPENFGREGFHINVAAFFIKIFGPTPASLRLANAIWGSLTLFGFYFLLRQLKFSRLSVILGTFMISFSFWHLVFSRTAYRAIMVPLLLVWIFYFFWKAIDSEKKKAKYYFAVSGLLLGLGFHTYIAFRIVPLILVIVALSFVLTKKGFWKTYWKSALIVFIAALIIALPMIVYFSGHIKDFLSRSEAVSVFNSAKMSPAAAAWKSFAVHINAFFVSGDKNPRHNYNNQPLLPAAWSVLFALGFFISFAEIAATFWNFLKRKVKNLDIKNNELVTKWFYVSVLAQSMFWAMLIPGILSIEGIPHSLRIIGMIPAVFLMAVLPFEYILNFYIHLRKNPAVSGNAQEGKKFLVIMAGIIIMVIYGGYTQVNTYFNVWAKDFGTYGAYERKIYNLGILIKSLPAKKNNYLITAYNTWISADGKKSSLETMEFISYPKGENLTFLRPMDGFNSISCDDPLIFFQESDQWLRDQYKNRCPNLAQQRYVYDRGKYIFWVMGSK
jgi:4-amino-4-deoxy-L-arabinose transferase-like glycosyltransferase